MTSRSLVLTAFGGYETLTVQEWPLRPLEADDVQVDVAVCGMNFADLYTRQGLLRDRQPPFVLGMECAGKVSSVGDKVTHIKVGDRVLCYQFTGDLFRERVVVRCSQCFMLPSGMSYEDGAAFAANYLTAYFCVFDIGHFRPGQSILINSCAGGVGWAATQLASCVNSVQVFGTCSPAKQDAVRQNGVTYPLSYEGYEQELLKVSPHGVDVVIDNMAGYNFTLSQQLLKPLGRAVLIGAKSMISGEKKLGLWSMLYIWWKTKNVNASDLIMNNRVVAGLHLGLLMEKDQSRVQEAMKHLFHLYEEGKIKPQIDSVWPMDKVVEASKVLAERRNVGKVLLSVNKTSDSQ